MSHHDEDRIPWGSLLGIAVGGSVLSLVVAFILTGGNIELSRIFGRRAQDVRYQNRQASPEMIEGKKQLIQQSLKELCLPENQGHAKVLKDQITESWSLLTEAARDDLPENTRKQAQAVVDDTFECSKEAQ
jgi:hypothetical protein